MGRWYITDLIQMKTKFKVLVLMTMGILVCAPQSSVAQNLNKALQKEYKKKLKEYKREGWKIDSDRSEEVVLMKHFGKLNADENLKTITGVSSNCKSTNICRQAALNNAQNEYARLVSGKIEGAFASIMKVDANHPQEEIDKMVGSLVNEVKADVSGVLQSSYSVYREKGGTKEYKTIFIVNEKALIGNMEKVLEQSVKETKLTIEEASSISKFVVDELKKESGNDEE